MRSLGLHTVGDLLEHLPSDSREARTVAALRAGEQATVAVEVRSIAARPVRRRGMRPLVEATVFDASGTHARDVLQPAVAGRALRARHAPAAARQGRRPRGLSASPTTPSVPRLGGDPPAGGEYGAVAHYPAAEGITSTQILTLVQGRAGRARRDSRGAAGGDAGR